MESPELKEYRFTFGQKYAHEEHPTFPAAHPDGYVTVIATDESQAWNAVVDLIGAAWAFCYPAPFSRVVWEELYPLGELARVDATAMTKEAQTYGRHAALAAAH